MPLEQLIELIVTEVLRNLPAHYVASKRMLTVQDIADVIDHSLLRPDITVKELIEGCALARRCRCVSVCVRPSDLLLVTRELAGSNVLPTTVVGFPHGTCTTETKAFETVDAVTKGAVEVDMVLNIGRLLSGEYKYIFGDIKTVADVAHSHGALVKVIFENYYLNIEQKQRACQLSEDAGADFVKTSTGYALGGATVEDVALMRRYCSSAVKVKAAGGIKDLDALLSMMLAGAVRVGTRATQAILDEAEKREKNSTLFLQ